MNHQGPFQDHLAAIAIDHTYFTYLQELCSTSCITACLLIWRINNLLPHHQTRFADLTARLSHQRPGLNQPATQLPSKISAAYALAPRNVLPIIAHCQVVTPLQIKPVELIKNLFRDFHQSLVRQRFAPKSDITAQIGIPEIFAQVLGGYLRKSQGYWLVGYVRTCPEHLIAIAPKRPRHFEVNNLIKSRGLIKQKAGLLQ